MPRLPCSTGRVANGTGRLSPIALPCASVSGENFPVSVMALATTVLGMDDYRRADICPIKQRFRVGVAHADAAVAAGDAEARAPVRAVNGVIAPEGHHPMDIRDVVVRAVRIDAAEAHLRRFHLDVVRARRRRSRGYARGHIDRAD